MSIGQSLVTSMWDTQLTMVLGCENATECDSFIATKCALLSNNNQERCAAHVISVPLNLTDRSSILGFSEVLHTQFGRLDYLILDMVTDEAKRNYFDYLGSSLIMPILAV